jgi:hypothetical protein
MVDTPFRRRGGHTVVDLMTTGEAARLLGVDPRTLRKYETPDGRWCVLFGFKFRVFHYGGDNKSTRRYDRNEVMQIARGLKRARECP